MTKFSATFFPLGQRGSGGDPPYLQHDVNQRQQQLQQYAEISDQPLVQTQVDRVPPCPGVVPASYSHPTTMRLREQKQTQT